MAGQRGGGCDYCDVAFSQIQAAMLSGNVSQAKEGITEALRNLPVSASPASTASMNIGAP